ncbi:MAG: hypothetical protein NDJ18_01545 [candidate division Zixibacteria bacterium]|nr:hypothetical protein [candidate division Zixibacteria bacterium]
MVPILTGDSSRAHYPFSFYLRALASGHTLVYDYQGSDPAFAPMDRQRSISIGDVDDGENDDFEIAIPTWPNNAAESGEGGTVYGVNGFANKALPSSRPACTGRHGFLGVVAIVPIISLKFNDNDTGVICLSGISASAFCSGRINLSYRCLLVRLTNCQSESACFASC